MRSICTLAILAGTLAASPALAQKFKLDTIEINGLTSVSDAQVRPALQEKPGDTVTIDMIKADQDLLVAALEKLNITGGVTTGLRNKNNGHADIIFTVKDNGVVKPLTVTVAPKLKEEVFVGNVKVDTATLLAATGLKPGDDLSNDKVAAAQKAIAAAYKAANVKVDITINGVNTQQPDGTYIVTWTITEKAIKKTIKDMDKDDGAVKTDGD